MMMKGHHSRGFGPLTYDPVLSHSWSSGISSLVVVDCHHGVVILDHRHPIVVGLGCCRFVDLGYYCNLLGCHCHPTLCLLREVREVGGGGHHPSLVTPTSAYSSGCEGRDNLDGEGVRESAFLVTCFEDYGPGLCWVWTMGILGNIVLHLFVGISRRTLGGWSGCSQESRVEVGYYRLYTSDPVVCLREGYWVEPSLPQ